MERDGVERERLEREGAEGDGAVARGAGTGARRAMAVVVRAAVRSLRVAVAQAADWIWPARCWLCGAPVDVESVGVSAFAASRDAFATSRDGGAVLPLSSVRGSPQRTPQRTPLGRGGAWCGGHRPGALAFGEPEEGAPAACASRSPRRCPRCAGELPPGVSGRTPCRSCARRAPAFGRVHPAWSYRDAAARACVLALKHGGRRDLAAPLVQLALEAWARSSTPPPPLPSPAGRRASDPDLGPTGVGGDVLVPVPSHPSRRLERGYDPAVRLAAELERAGAGRVVPLLRRVRATPPQGSPGAPGRRSNVRGAFRVRGRIPSSVHVWLVDDVVTSGSTAHECAVALRRAGARRVDVLALARA